MFLGRRILVYLKGFWYTHVLVGLEEIAEFGALLVERMSGPRGSSWRIVRAITLHATGVYDRTTGEFFTRSCRGTPPLETDP